MEKRFWLFTYCTYYPSGGLNDFYDGFDSAEQAYEELKTENAQIADWFQLVDMETREEINCGRIRVVGQFENRFLAR